MELHFGSKDQQPWAENIFEFFANVKTSLRYPSFIRAMLRSVGFPTIIDCAIIYAKFYRAYINFLEET